MNQTIRVEKILQPKSSKEKMVTGLWNRKSKNILVRALELCITICVTV